MHRMATPSSNNKSDNINKTREYLKKLLSVIDSWTDSPYPFIPPLPFPSMPQCKYFVSFSSFFLLKFLHLFFCWSVPSRCCCYDYCCWRCCCGGNASGYLNANKYKLLGVCRTALNSCLVLLASLCYCTFWFSSLRIGFPLFIWLPETFCIFGLYFNCCYPVLTVDVVRWIRVLQFSIFDCCDVDCL